jgi:DNA-directed RNA polymerase subunit RPC12/RpoP
MNTAVCSECGCEFEFEASGEKDCPRCGYPNQVMTEADLEAMWESYKEVKSA